VRLYNRLGGAELLALGLLTENVVLFFDVPRRYFEIGGNAAYLSLIVSALVALPVFYMVGLALEKMPGEGLPDLMIRAFGTIGGKTLNFLIWLHISFGAALTARLLGEAIIMTSIPGVPISVVVGGALLFSVYSSYRGLNSLAKSCYVALPFIAAGVFVLMAISITNWRSEFLYPVLGLGFQNTILSGVLAAGAMGEISIIAIYAGKAQIGVPRLKMLITALVVTAVVQVFIILSISMAFPYPVARELTLPYYMLSRSISIGIFLQRLESVFLVTWALASILKIAVLYNAGLFIYRHTFAIKDGLPLLLPYAGMCFALALMPNNYVEAASIAWHQLRLRGGLVTLALPFLAASLSLWSMAKKKSKATGPMPADEG
jgi:spore germination protein KB